MPTPRPPNNDQRGWHFDVTVSAEISHVRDVRLCVRHFLVVGGATDGDAATMELVISELFTNAAEHVPGANVTIVVDATPPATWTVTMTSAPIRSSNPVHQQRSWSPPDATARRGRGLSIVSVLLDDIDVRDDATALTISGLLRRGDDDGARR